MKREITVDHRRRKEWEVDRHYNEQRVCRSSKQPFPCSPSPFLIINLGITTTKNKFSEPR